MPESTPDIAVIVAVHNDSNNVLNAIRSAQEQTHRSIEIIVVDDCSTDDGFAKVEEHALGDSRIRVFQTPVNSGGAGAPRNLGMTMAIAPRIMFLDSDDRLDRHACKNLLREVEKNDAELVMGQTKRFTVKTKRWAGWHARLYRENQFYESIEQFPELCIDTNSVAKLYSMDFLRSNNIRFPEGIHYEDLVFTAMVFKAVRNIAVIPEVVYVWKIYPIVERKSITNQRDSIQNLLYRIEALAIIKGLFNDAENPLLFARLQLKVLRHDARLYLNDVVKRDDSMSEEILASLKPLILSVPKDCFDQLNLGEKLLYAAALSGDVEAVRQASTMARGRATLRGHSVVQGDSLLWLPDLFSNDADESLGKKLATVPLQTLARVPWFKTQFFNQVMALDQINASSISVVGETQDWLGALECIDQISFRLRVFTRGPRSQNFYVPMTGVAYDDGKWTWEAKFEIPTSLRALDVSKLGLRVEIGSPLARSENHLHLGKDVSTRKVRIRASSLLGKAARDRYQAYRTIDETIGFRLVKPGRYGRPIRKVMKPALKCFDLAITIADSYVPIGKPEWKLAYSVFRKMPVARGTALFESHMGKSRSDSPRVIADELARTHPEITQTWSFENNSPHQGTVGRNVTRGSLKYLYQLARSEYLIDNQTLPGYFRKRSGQTYVQTWHGVPLKRMGFDEPDFAMGSKKKQSELSRRVNDWDYLTNPSIYFQNTFVPAYKTKAELLPFGSPRNDALANLSTDHVDVLRKQLGLSADVKTVLYAPTFRAASRKGNSPIELEMDLDYWIEALGSDVQLLVRAHYLNRLSIPSSYADRVIDVSGVDDTSSLLAVADVLITDYSSVMFDYAVLNRPVIIYAYDLAEYVDSERGTYFDLEESRPGALVSTQEELHEAVRIRMLEDPDAGQRQEFYSTYMGKEDGTAARRSVATIWGEQK